MVQNKNLSTLIFTTLQNLIDKGYREAAIKDYKETYRSLEIFCQRNNFCGYNEEIGRNFIKSKRACTSLKRYTTAIQRLDCMMNGTEWQPIRKKNEALPHSSYDRIVTSFESYLRQNNKTEVAIRSDILITARFLRFLEEANCQSLTDLKPQHCS